MTLLTDAAIVLACGLSGGAAAYVSILALGRLWDAARDALDDDIEHTVGGA